MSTEQDAGSNVLPAWYEEAACKGMSRPGFSVFYPPDNEHKDAKAIREAIAKATCADCEVRVLCLDYALRNEEKEGIWGGLNEEERRQISHRRRR